MSGPSAKDSPKQPAGTGRTEPVAAAASSGGAIPELPLQSPGIVNSGRFCTAGRTLAGTTPVANLDRLCDLLADDAGEVSWSFAGRRGRSADGGIHDWLSLKGLLKAQLYCARCDEPAPFESAIDRQFLLVGDEKRAAQLDEEAEDHDVLVGGDHFSLDELLEDECVMALPGFLTHADCAPAVEAPETEPSEHPFAALAKLRKTASD